MHANIKSFTSTLPVDFELQSPQFSFEEISSRMPHLTDIDIWSSISMHDIETQMASLISHLPKLNNIILPWYYLTTRFTEALSRLPDIAAILLSNIRGDPIDVRPFAPNLTDGAFPTLQLLSMTTAFHDTARFFKTKFSPINLTKLYVEPNINETPPSIQSLLSAVSENCQVLRVIRLISYPGKNSVLEDANQFADRDMTIDILKPLLKLSKLISIQLTH